jgi:transcriptional regulator with XRE-family HTH domain
VPPAKKVRKIPVKADPTPVFTLDARELWAAAARAGLDPVTSKAVAEYVGVHEATLSRVLAGKRRPPASMLAALAVAFPSSYTRIARAVVPPNGKAP